MFIPTARVHKQQAINNSEAAENIRDAYPDWSVIMCFYAALHWVEFYAKSQNVNINREWDGNSPHDRRRNYVYDLAEQLNNNDLISSYQYLERESKKARYLERLSQTSRDYYNTRRQDNLTRAFNALRSIQSALVR